ncbi:MAG: hypothetical protein HY558_03620 [Euryarchaeota archaeon]|nr:hypothetical protein [Euryarchaeota archaeon]
MKALIRVSKEGKYFVAVDLVTHVADQGKTKREAISRLKRGLESHYQVLMEMARKDRRASVLELDIPHAETPGPVG